MNRARPPIHWGVSREKSGGAGKDNGTKLKIQRKGPVTHVPRKCEVGGGQNSRMRKVPPTQEKEKKRA